MALWLSAWALELGSPAGSPALLTHQSSDLKQVTESLCSEDTGVLTHHTGMITEATSQGHCEDSSGSPVSRGQTSV